jgi:hypothetical protein
MSDLCDAATDIVATALSDGGVKVALEILKGAGVLNRRPFEYRSESPEHLRSDAELTTLSIAVKSMSQ